MIVTHIILYRSDKTAKIQTNSKIAMRKLELLVKQYPDECKEAQQRGDTREFTVPAEWVRIQPKTKRKGGASEDLPHD